jgi:hypothetical protein
MRYTPPAILEVMAADRMIQAVPLTKDVPPFMDGEHLPTDINPAAYPADE